MVCPWGNGFTYTCISSARLDSLQKTKVKQKPTGNLASKKTSDNKRWSDIRLSIYQILTASNFI